MRRRLGLGLALLATASGIACVGVAAANAGARAPRSASTTIKLPASIQKSGVLYSALETEYPPYEFVNSAGKPQGIDVQLVRAVGKVLGVKVRFQPISFESEIPGVADKRYDMVTVEDADTVAREKQVSFVDIFKTELQAIVLKGNPDHVNPRNLCGETMSSGSGSFQTAALQVLSKACTKAGKPAITILNYATTAQQIQAVLTRRAVAWLAVPAVVSYYARQNRQMAVLPAVVPIPKSLAAVQGWPIQKDPVLAAALVKAINVLIKDGTWEKILKANGAQTGALIPPLVNRKRLVGS
jgi:polar amino acid transport system substrate-binding protein